MTLFKTTFMAATLMLGASAVTTAYAQDAMTDKAKSMAIKEGKKVAKDKAADMVGEETRMMSDKGIDMGADMMEGKSMKDAAVDAAMDSGKSEGKTMMKEAVIGDTMETEAGSMDGEDMMTAGKVMVKGGSAEDAAMAVAKENAKDHVKDMLIKNTGEVAVQSDPLASPVKSMKVPMQTMPVPEGATRVDGKPVMNSGTTMVSNCPLGTTAQPNGTCMITGDYNPG